MFTPGARIDLGVWDLRRWECLLQSGARGARLTACVCKKMGGRHGN